MIKLHFRRLLGRHRHHLVDRVDLVLELQPDALVHHALSVHRTLPLERLGDHLDGHVPPVPTQIVHVHRPRLESLRYFLSHLFHERARDVVTLPSRRERSPPPFERASRRDADDAVISLSHRRHRRHHSSQRRHRHPAPHRPRPRPRPRVVAPPSRARSTRRRPVRCHSEFGNQPFFYEEGIVSGSTMTHS